MDAEGTMHHPPVTRRYSSNNTWSVSCTSTCTHERGHASRESNRVNGPASVPYNPAKTPHHLLKCRTTVLSLSEPQISYPSSCHVSISFLLEFMFIIGTLFVSTVG